MVTDPAGLASAAVAVALALTSWALLSAITSRLPPPPLPAGVYYGWTDGLDGRFQVVGDACPDGQLGNDALVGASLNHRNVTFAFSPPAVDDTPEPLAFASAVPVITFGPEALVRLVAAGAAVPAATRPASLLAPFDTAVSRLMVRCRSHAETSVRLGSAAFSVVPGTTNAGPAASVTARRVPPTAGLLGVLIISNDADETITLASLRFAPAGAATGTILAAAGDHVMLPSWLGTAFGSPAVPVQDATEPTIDASRSDPTSGAPATRPLSGTVDPATLNPWDAAYLGTGDPRVLRAHDAEALDLVLRPGEMAIIVVTEGALRRTLVTRPVLLYPVLGYAHGDETTWLGLTAPLFGAAPSWR